MCDAGLSTDATFTSDEAPWEVVPMEAENNVENDKKGGEEADNPRKETESAKGPPDEEEADFGDADVVETPMQKEQDWAT